MGKLLNWATEQRDEILIWLLSITCILNTLVFLTGGGPNYFSRKERKRILYSAFYQNWNTNNNTLPKSQTACTLYNIHSTSYVVSNSTYHSRPENLKKSRLKKNREIDIFDFISFLACTFSNFLAHCEASWTKIFFIFCQMFSIFDDFSKFCRAYSTLKNY